jgi:hypothetical protein
MMDQIEEYPLFDFEINEIKAFIENLKKSYGENHLPHVLWYLEYLQKEISHRLSEPRGRGYGTPFNREDGYIGEEQYTRMRHKLENQQIDIQSELYYYRGIEWQQARNPIGQTQYAGSSSNADRPDTLFKQLPLKVKKAIRGQYNPSNDILVKRALAPLLFQNVHEKVKFMEKFAGHWLQKNRAEMIGISTTAYSREK